MNFSELYKDNKYAIDKALRAMWCGESCNDSQKAYIEQLKVLIENLFAPKEAIPVVQCMNSYESVHTVDEATAENLVGDLWQKTMPTGKHYPPYEHQYKSWNTLLNETDEKGKPKSIVVTTGTGSGKTECFMLPLVHDLERRNVSGQIQALFLYPLNALMEDQKERLEQILNGTNLTYTVYNGDLPEKEPKDTDNSEEAVKLRRRIELITGGKYQTIIEGGKQRFELTNKKFKKMLYTREQVRETPPNILLTNPTMLEYILLRGSDSVLINPANHSLSWVAIDETHTYTGAGAAELAMLLRRVFIAFDVYATNIRFATSSATFGNASTQEEKEEEKDKLKEFISGITGTSKNQVEVVDGKRIGEDCIPEGEDGVIWKRIFDADFLELDQVITGEYSVEERLQLLDELCSREEQRYKAAGKAVPDMKLKVHYFYRVPNNGLFVRLDEHENGAFKIYTQNVLNNGADSKTPLLELSRCKLCGEYVAVGKLNTTDWTYSPLIADDSDMFDLPDNDDDTSSDKYFIFGLSKEPTTPGDNNAMFKLTGEKLMPMTPAEYRPGEWHIVGNTQCRCPYCNTKQTKGKINEREAEGDATSNIEDNRLKKFRLSSEFISRRMANSVLNQLEKNKTEEGDKIKLHDGQQFISFVDSRQAAAKATLKQNLDQERLWFYTTIYHELCKRRANGLTREEALAQQLQAIAKAAQSQKIDEINKINAVITNLNSSDEKVVERQLAELSDHSISWMEIAELILKDKYCPTFCSLFIKRTGDSEELDKEGNIAEGVMEKYVQSIMVMYLSNRPASAAAPETLGLFHTCYPQLKNIELPEAVSNFNNILKNKVNYIDEEDWQNLIQIFMDHTVRSNQSVFLKIPGNNAIDIFSCVRFATEKPRRRPVKKPYLEPGKSSTSRIIRYLCGLIIRDDNTLTIKDAQNIYFNEINAVLDAFWETLNLNTNALLETSQHLNETYMWENDRENAIRFNLVNLSFKLYEDVYLCDATTDAESKHTLCLRPIENNFKRFSPYLAAGMPIELKETFHEKWEVYPYYVGSGKENPTKEELYSWAKENRKILWDNSIWGEDGVFSTHLDDVHLTPNLFIQAEHTAQVDKDVARELQADFKEHFINILACSTTMEMGVDLGNLEVVLLSSVPPMPANYKQRAGRSGRNNKVRSACITLCDSDAIGLRTLYKPIEKIISRPVQVPTVDLKSPQVVQRHVNSYLVRAFGVFANGNKGGSLKQKVVDYYTTFHIENDGGRLKVFDMNNSTMSPNEKLGNEKGTMYELFNECCTKPLEAKQRMELDTLLKNTIYEGKRNVVVNNAYEQNRKRYAELSIKIEDFAVALQNTDNQKFKTKLYMMYLEVLNDKLLNYWATNRFTPNANMPVNVLSLDLNTTGKKDYITPSTSTNPSYSLKDAISQYAPGNTVVVDGVVYTVRGVECSSIYQDSKPFKKIFHNLDKTVIDDPNSLVNKMPWPVNNSIGVDLIQPAGFLPDINEDKTRIIDNNEFTHVSAQLIDANVWTTGPTEPHLFSVRNNRESGNAKILYYNEGKGHGYCFCPRCGRMVLENEVADEDQPFKFPIDFNPYMPKREFDENGEEITKPKYHFAISGKNYRKKCSGSNNLDVIKRNVIIGDLIQTDFAEIRLRHKNMTNKWISNRDDEQNLLFTLGIVFSQALTDILGKERGSVSFAIMPNGHLCIFDVNPGGAGYSNQLANILTMRNVILTAERMLKEAKEHNSKDMLLDKFTLRFMKYIDIDAALDWIKEENEAWKEVPQNIKDAFKEGKPEQQTFLSLKKTYTESESDIVLFFEDDYQNWDYNETENGWRNQYLNSFLSKGADTVTFCISKSANTYMREPIKEMLRAIKGWAKEIVEVENPFKENGIYPLAYIDGTLFFTNSKENAVLNEQWSNNAIYSIRTLIDFGSVKEVNCEHTERSTNIILQSTSGDYTSKQLAKYLQDKVLIIKDFIESIKDSNEPLKVTYQDEHLKSVLGMIITLQTIEHYIKQIGKDFSLEFKFEKYEDFNSKTSIMANLCNSTVRNNMLKELVEKWSAKLREENSIICDLTPIESAERNTLTHWRELAISCGERTLSIYPDGGFANGWAISSKNEKRFNQENTDTNDDIIMYLKNNIKFNIAVE